MCCISFVNLIISKVSTIFLFLRENKKKKIKKKKVSGFRHQRTSGSNHLVHTSSCQKRFYLLKSCKVYLHTTLHLGRLSRQKTKEIYLKKKTGKKFFPFFFLLN